MRCVACPLLSSNSITDRDLELQDIETYREAVATTSMNSHAVGWAADRLRSCFDGQPPLNPVGPASQQSLLDRRPTQRFDKFRCLNASASSDRFMELDGR